MIGIHAGVLQAEEQGYTTLAITVPPSVAPTTVGIPTEFPLSRRGVHEDAVM